MALGRQPLKPCLNVKPWRPDRKSGYLGKKRIWKTSPPSLLRHTEGPINHSSEWPDGLVIILIQKGGHWSWQCANTPFVRYLKDFKEPVAQAARTGIITFPLQSGYRKEQIKIDIYATVMLDSQCKRNIGFSLNIFFHPSLTFIF